MLCSKCGREYPDDADFCIQCGASVISDETISEIPNSEAPMTKKEYFMSKCSTSTKQKRKAVKILSAASLTIQGVLAVLVIIAIIKLSLLLTQHSVLGDGSFLVLTNIIPVVIWTAGSFVFTLLGLKKNSTGLFVSATIFAFLSAIFSAGLGFKSLALRQLIGFGTLAIYIVIVVLNHQINKEYKGYTSQYSTANKKCNGNISQFFATNKGGNLMKRVLFLIISIVLLCVFTASALSSCGAQSCHNCGDPVGSDPVKAGGRTYCSYDCYMDEVLFD